MPVRFDLAQRLAGGAAAVLVAVALAFAVAPRASALTPDAQPADGAPVTASLLQRLRKVSLRDIGRAPAPADMPLQAVPDAKPSSGKPGALYVGAEFCPYCAATRWPVVLALLRFGRFSGLAVSSSSSTDVYPDTPTFSFLHARYASRWLDVETVETADREQHPLQRPTTAQLARMARFDTEPYTQYPGSIPFLDLGDRWILVGSAVDPGLYQGLDFHAVSAQLESGKGPLWTAVLGAADAITAKLCVLTHGQPQATCSKLGARGEPVSASPPRTTP